MTDQQIADQNNLRISELVPGAQALARHFLDLSAGKGMRIRITEAYRTPERQDYDYAQGRSRPGAIITWVNGSNPLAYHVQRRAFDVFDMNKTTYNEVDWNTLGQLGKSVGLTWGGDFPKPKTDRPHFEYHGPEAVEAVVPPPVPATEFDPEDERKARMIYDYAYDLIKGGFPDPHYFEAVEHYARDHAMSLQDSVNPAFREQYANELSGLNHQYVQFTDTLYKRIS